MVNKHTAEIWHAYGVYHVYGHINYGQVGYPYKLVERHFPTQSLFCLKCQSYPGHHEFQTAQMKIDTLFAFWDPPSVKRMVGIADYLWHLLMLGVRQNNPTIQIIYSTICIQGIVSKVWCLDLRWKSGQLKYTLSVKESYHFFRATLKFRATLTKIPFESIKRTLYSEKNMNSLNVEYILAMNIQNLDKNG